MKIYPVLNQTQRHEYVWTNGGIAPRILNLVAGLRRAVNFTTRSLYPLLPIEQETGWAPEPVCRRWRRE